MDLTDLTLYEAAGLIERRQISPVELAQAYLEQIARENSRFNAFIRVTGGQALHQARQAEDEIGRGERRGMLHGIPLGLKDLFETRDVCTTAGSPFFAAYTPQADAFVVQKLLEGGAVLLGKLNMHEIALGVTNENPHFGDCRNPWNTACISGGSSGGSAAALAARLCLGALGTDTGGSIRIPASLCGVVGLKPTYGRVSLRGVIPLSWNMDHAGPMARNIRDAAILLQCMAGYDPEDAGSAPAPVDDYLARLEAGVRGWRIGLAADDFFVEAEPAVLAAVRKAADVFEDLGARVDEVAVPWARAASQANGLMVTSDAAAFHEERLRENPAGFGEDVLARLKSGAAFTSTEYALARRTQAQVRRRFDLLFERYDLLLTPATPAPAARRGSANAVERARQLTRFTAPFNLTGLPALSVPCGFSPDGLPLGLQMASRAWGEAGLLRAAYAYELAANWNMNVNINR